MTETNILSNFYHFKKETFINTKIMNKLIRNNGSQISPCILAQVRFTLDNNRRRPINKKTCSIIYWNEIVKIVAEKNNITNFNEYLK